MIALQSKPKKQFIFDRPGWIWLGFTIIVTVFAFLGVAKVPFHPDESTYLFMSQDFNEIFSDPSSLAWSPYQTVDLRTHYRLIDPPLTRYLLGFSRYLVGLKAIKVDWDWAATWEENESAGALPDPMLLNVSRIMMTMLLPFNMLLLYLIGKRIQSPLTGLLAAILFGLNPLALLHGRRAMAEGLMIFGVLLSVWSFLKLNNKP